MQLLKNNAGEKNPQGGEQLKARNSKEMEIDFSKFPSIEFNKSQLEQQKRLVEKLNKRKELAVKRDDLGIDEYEANEREILLIQTDVQLANAHAAILKKEASIKDYIDNTIKPNYEAISGISFTNLLENAKLRAVKDHTMRKYLSSTDWSVIAENWDYKINFYLSVKKYLQEAK